MTRRGRPSTARARRPATSDGARRPPATTSRKPSRTGLVGCCRVLRPRRPGIGGWLLFNALAGRQRAGQPARWPTTSARPLDEVTASSTSSTWPSPCDRGEPQYVSENIVYRTDPAPTRSSSTARSITLFFNPAAAPGRSRTSTGQSRRCRHAHAGGSGFGSSPSPARPATSSPRATVIRTDPAAGQQVKPGHAVNLVVSPGPERQAVPSRSSAGPRTEAGRSWRARRSSSTSTSTERASAASSPGGRSAPTRRPARSSAAAASSRSSSPAARPR